MTRVVTMQSESDEVGAPPGREAARGRAALMTRVVTMQSESDEEERRL